MLSVPVTTRGAWEMTTVLWNQQQREEEEEKISNAIDSGGSTQTTIAPWVHWSARKDSGGCRSLLAGGVAQESTVVIQGRNRQCETTVPQDNLEEKLIDGCARGLEKS